MLKYFQRGFKALQNAQQARADYWLLHNMTDKELKDIGITRGNINQVLVGKF
jgi:uncharacterized protein YjiS (DUF1127 family)